MATEFYVSFPDTHWYASHRDDVRARLSRLKTFAGRRDDEVWLRGTEPGPEDRWAYDVRFLFRAAEQILMEVSAHPKSVEEDLLSFFAALRTDTEVAVFDEDGEASGW